MTVDISILVPAYNEAKLIGQGIGSIVENLRDVSYEIVVVDNGSTDATAQVAAGFPYVRVLSIPKSTVSRARNSGATLATGVLFVFLDADVKITAQWAATILKKLKKVKADSDYLGGFPYDIPKPASLMERAWFAASMTGKPSYVGSGNLIVSAALFRRINGFDESLVTTEDMDFSHRAVQTGQRIEFDPGFAAIHLGFPRSARQFVRREMWHGVGGFRSLRGFLGSKVSIASALFAGLLLGGVVSLLVGFDRLGLILLSMFLALPLLYVIYRFRLKNMAYLPVQYLIGYLYLGARAISGIRSILKLSSGWHRA